MEGVIKMSKIVYSIFAGIQALFIVVIAPKMLVIVLLMFVAGLISIK